MTDTTVIEDTRMVVTVELNPKAPTPEQVIIRRDGQVIERCTLADRRARLAAHGYPFVQAPRTGCTASGRPVRRKIARLPTWGD